MSYKYDPYRDKLIHINDENPIAVFPTANTTWIGNYCPYKCEHCGRYVDSKERYCPNCGREATNYE